MDRPDPRHRRGSAPAPHRAFEIIGDPTASGPFVFTCEHATCLLPDWEPEPADLPFLQDHWGWDIGAADLTRALVDATGSCGVLSRFSRLVCDPNRTPSEPSFILEEVDGHRLSFNRGLDEAEHRRRRRLYFDAYHDAVDRTLRTRLAIGTPVRLCTIHSFTPLYRGRARSMEIGVLFDHHEHHAHVLAEALEQQAYAVALNAPYSGREGLTYAAQRHGLEHDIVHLELEVRQDLIQTPARVRSAAARIARALASYAPRD